MDLTEFEIDRTCEALEELGKRSLAAQLFCLTLLLTAAVWIFGTTADEVELPLLGVDLATKTGAAFALLLGSVGYLLVNLFNSYRLLLEQRLEALLQSVDKDFKLRWNCKYPGVTTYVANVHGKGTAASAVGLVLVGGTVLVPFAFLVLLLGLSCSSYGDWLFWLTALLTGLLTSLGLAIFCSSALTPSAKES